MIVQQDYGMGTKVVEQSEKRKKRKRIEELSEMKEEGKAKPVH